MSTWKTLLVNDQIPDTRTRPPQPRRRARRKVNDDPDATPKNAKLTWSKVRKIRVLFFDEGWTVKQLVAEFEVSDTCMKNIVNYQSWVPK